MTDVDNLPDWMVTAEVATLFRVNVGTVKRMIARGELAAVKIGRTWRIPREAVAAMLTLP
jgi:excisionase family DNA binding protein